MTRPGTQEATSRWLSWALRHEPAAAGITLDAQGWTDIEALIAAAGRQGHALTQEGLVALVAASDKQRFAISADGRSIRANQGHSLTVDLGLEAVAPPLVLYHGTAQRFLGPIMREGLLRQSRQQVHLSAERATALLVGRRHGSPVVLTVAAGRMHADGARFFLAANGVWLTDAVAPGYLSVDGLGQEREAAPG